MNDTNKYLNRFVSLYQKYIRINYKISVVRLPIYIFTLYMTFVIERISGEDANPT